MVRKRNGLRQGWRIRIGPGKLLAGGFTMGLAVFVAGPMAMILGQPFLGDRDVSISEYIRKVAEYSFAPAAVHSLELGLAVAALGALVSVPLAFASMGLPARLRGLVDHLLLLPFMTSPFIGAIGWILFIEPGGFLQQMAPGASVFQPLFFSPFGLAFLMATHLFPVLYSNLRVHLAGLDRRLIESAQVHGANAVQRLARIWMPLLMRSLVPSGLLVFVMAIGEFGSPMVFGGLLQFPVLTTGIYRDMTDWPIDFASASEQGTVLLLMSVSAWLAYALYQRMRAYPVQSVSEDSSRDSPRPAGNLRLRGLSTAFVALVLFLSVGIPYSAVLFTSLLRVEGEGISFHNLTFAHYARILHVGSSGWAALTTSLTLAFAAAGITLVLGTAIAVLARFRPSRLIQAAELVAILPSGIPALLVAVGLIFFWNAPWLRWTLYDTPWILIAGFVLLFLPVSFLPVKQTLVDLSPSLWEAGFAHGANRGRVAAKILAPLLFPVMAAGFALVFAVSFRDLALPMLIAPPDLTTAATYIYGQFDQGDLANGMAMAVISVVITGLFSWVAKSPNISKLTLQNSSTRDHSTENSPRPSQNPPIQGSHPTALIERSDSLSRH